MGLSKQIFLFSLFSLVLLASAATESSDGTPQLRVAPHKIFRTDIIDGSGEGFNVDSTKKGLGDWKSTTSKVSISTVALFTLAMAAATGLGAVPFFFVELDPQWAGLCNGMAAGVMLAASFDLIQEGQEHGSGSWVVIGILAGGIFILLCKKVITMIF